MSNTNPTPPSTPIPDIGTSPETDLPPWIKKPK